MFQLNPNSGVPIYRQLIEQAQRMIAGGQLKPGDELPSVRELAIEQAVNPMTISKAYSLLEAEGLLVRQRGKPMQVAPRPESGNDAAENAVHLHPEFAQLRLAARQLRLSDRQLVAALKKYLSDSADKN
jgi:GntR family transcriptional regulator